MIGFTNERITAVCPSCGSSFNAKLLDVKNERVVHCPRGHSVHLVDEGNGVKQLDKELSRFKREMKSTERKMARESRRLRRKLK